MRNALEAIVAGAVMLNACGPRQPVENPILTPAPPVPTPTLPYEHQTEKNPNGIPALHEFIKSVENGNPKKVVGFYSERKFALNVVPQPDNDTLVDRENLTLYIQNDSLVALAAERVTVGREFTELDYTDPVSVIMGDGSVINYAIESITQLAALDGDSTASDFQTPDGRILSGNEMIDEYIKNKRNDLRKIALITCGRSLNTRIIFQGWEIIPTVSD